MKRFNTEFNVNNVGEEVVLYGWASKIRNLGGIIFIDLRDRSGIIQLVINPDSKCYEVASKVKNEYTLSVSGKIEKRANSNNNIKTGEIEVILDSIEIWRIDQIIKKEYIEKTSINLKIKIKNKDEYIKGIIINSQNKIIINFNDLSLFDLNEINLNNISY